MLGAGLAAALVAGALALSPAAVAEEEEGSGEAPFGEQIEPGTSFADTAEVTTGTYTLNIPEAGADHFFEIPRTEPDQVIWYGVTSQLDTTVDSLSSLTFEGTAEGDSTLQCNSDPFIVDVDPRSFLTSLSSANRSPDCRDAESITIRIANGSLGDGEPLPTDVFYQLVVWVEPPLAGSEQLPGANEDSPWVEMPEPEGEPEPLEGARTFSEAEDLADGHYETTVVKGRPAIFGFPLTYGQHAQVEVRSEGTTDTFETLEPVWVTPLGGQLRQVNPAGGPPPALAYDGEEPAGWSTPIVTYQNRMRTGGIGALGGGSSIGNSPAAPAAFAGTYFLAVEISDDEFSDAPDEVPVTMTVRTVTDYEGSAPEYAEEPAPLSALDGSGFVATAEEEQAAREAQAPDPESTPWLLVVGLFVGATLLAAVGGLAVGRVRRGRA